MTPFWWGVVVGAVLGRESGVRADGTVRVLAQGGAMKIWAACVLCLCVAMPATAGPIYLGNGAWNRDAPAFWDNRSYDRNGVANIGIFLTGTPGSDVPGFYDNSPHLDQPGMARVWRCAVRVGRGLAGHGAAARERLAGHGPAGAAARWRAPVHDAGRGVAVGHAGRRAQPLRAVPRGGGVLPGPGGCDVDHAAHGGLGLQRCRGGTAIYAVPDPGATVLYLGLAWR